MPIVPSAVGGDDRIERSHAPFDDVSSSLERLRVQLHSVENQARAAEVAADGAKEAADSAVESAGAAQKASEAVAAAQRSLLMAGTLPRGTFFGPALFGAVIGVLTGLSSQIGTTATLIGLLFAAIGGSLVAWYRTDGLPTGDRGAFLCSLGGLSGGLLGGLLLAFLGRAFEAGWFSTLSNDGGREALMASRQDISKRAYEIARISLDAATKDGKALTDNDFATVERLLKIGSEQAVAATSVSVAKPKPPVFVLQSASASKVDEVINDLNELKTNAMDDAQKSKIIDELLVILRQTREKLSSPPRS